MKVLITNKKRVILALCILITVCAAIVGFIYCENTGVMKQSGGLPIYSVQTDKKQIAISFDAAWGNEDTQSLIDILNKYNVKATFFLVGSWVDHYPNSVKDLAAAGHSIQNHSNTHPYLTQIGTEKAREEILACNQKVEKLTGKSPILLRPPYGDYNADVITLTESLKMYPIQWSVDSLDWMDISADEIYNNVVPKIKAGDIVLFHNAAKHTPEALPRIIEDLQKQGYELVLIEDLIYKDNYKIDVSGKQMPAK
ncbi:MAG: polysaccharide deacetylase family protein [Clostridia bacterium]|nr:polysaccharide deacetylase family protein [Clostridia bacterium]